MLKWPASHVRTLRRQGITILVLAVAMGAYLAVFVPARRAFLSERYFRVLAGMGNQITETLGNLAGSTANAVRAPRPLPKLDPPPNRNSPILFAFDQAAALSNASSASPSPSATTRESLDSEFDRIRQNIRLVPHLEIRELGTNAVTPTSTAKDANSADTSLSVELKGVSKGSWIEFASTNGVIHLRTRAEFRRIFASVAGRTEFDDLLLLDARDPNGTALFQFASGAAQIQRLTLPVDRSSQSVLTNLAGAMYIAFSQPVQFVPPSLGTSPGTSVSWILCGLVRSDRFQQESWSVSYTLLVVVSFLAVLVVVSWPLLNVWSLGHRGGFNLREVFLLFVSTVAFNGFATLLVLDLLGRERLQRTSDDQLQGLSSEIQSNFQTEMRRVGRQLAALNERFANSPSNQIRLLTRTDIIVPSSAEYPYFGMATWVERDSGTQLAKWTVRKHITPAISVRHREYYRAIAESRPWLLQASTNDPASVMEYCLEPIFSSNTGEYFATFSARPQSGGITDWRVISTIDSRLLSLINPTLPAGFGYSVIDASGRVVFHSEESRSLREDFFQECEMDHQLRAAVAGRKSKQLHTRYQGVDHALFITPLASTPWSLVTFRDKRVAGTMLVEAVSVAVICLISYCGVFAAIIGLVYFTGKRRALSWLWPSEHRADAYGVLFAFNLAVGLILIFMILSSREGLGACLAAAAAVPVSLCVSLGVLGRGGLGFSRFRWLQSRVRIRLPFRVGYVLSLGTLLLIASTLPTLAFFRASFFVEARLLVKRAQLQLAEDLLSRSRRLWAEIQGQSDTTGAGELPLATEATQESAAKSDQTDTYASTRGESERSRFLSRSQFLKRRLDEKLDIYSEFFFRTDIRWDRVSANATGLKSLPTLQPRLETWLQAIRPNYNEEDVRTRATAGTGAVDRAWSWNEQVSSAVGSTAVSRIEFIRSGIRLPGNTNLFDLRLTSDEPAWSRIPWPWAFVFIPLLGLPFAVVYLISSRVLLLHVPAFKPSDQSRHILGSGAPSNSLPFGRGRYLFLAPPRTDLTAHLNSARFSCLEPAELTRIDLRKSEDMACLAPERIEAWLESSKRNLVIDGFEDGHDDPTATDRKLRFLQKVAFDESRTVILASCIHPFHFSFGINAGTTPPGNPPDATRLTEWVDCVQEFQSLYAASPSQTATSSKSGGHTTFHTRTAFRAIWQTCSPAEQELLHEIASGRLVNSGHPQLRILLERRLLIREPSLQVSDPSFRRFILGAYRPGQLTHENAAEPSSVWASLKGPVFTSLLMIAAFLFLTQKDMWNNTVGLIGTFLAGVGTLAKVSELFQRSRSGSLP